MSDLQIPNGVNPTNTNTAQTSDSQIEALLAENEQIQKLLSSVDKTLESIDENLETNNEDMKDYFDDQEKKEDKKRNQFFENLTAQFENTKQLLTSNLKNVQTNLVQALKSPFALITEPFEKLLGIDLGGIFSSLSKDLFGFGKKKGKKKPTEDQVAQIGKEGTGFLYLGNLFKKFFGKGDDDKGGLMEKIKGFSMLAGGGGVGAMITKALPKIAGSLGIGAIVAGVVWAVIDGVRGFFKADEWGVSKGAGVAGSVLGGMGSGIKNAFKNAGKFALIGGGVGFLVGGPIGALVGGLIGAVLGGVLGFFGGEKIAKGMDKVASTITQKVLPWLVDVGKGIIQFVVGAITGAISFVQDTASSLKNVITETVFPSIKGFFVSIFSGISNYAKEGTFLADLVRVVLAPINIIIDGFSFLEEKLLGTDFIATLYEKLTTAVTGFFDSITSIFSFIKDVGFVNLAKGLFTGNIGNMLSEYQAKTEPTTTINDGIVTKTGKVINTSPDDNIFATKKEIVVSPSGGGSSDPTMAMLLRTIENLSNKIAMLEPKIINQSTVVKSFAGSQDLKTFER